MTALDHLQAAREHIVAAIKARGGPQPFDPVTRALLEAQREVDAAMRREQRAELERRT